MADAITVYITFGNSDHKLSQKDWSDYSGEVVEAIYQHAERVLGEYYSAPNAVYQNACVAAQIPAGLGNDLRQALVVIRSDYGKNAIHWAEVAGTKRV